MLANRGGYRGSYMPRFKAGPGALDAAEKGLPAGGCRGPGDEVESSELRRDPRWRRTATPAKTTKKEKEGGVRFRARFRSHGGRREGGRRALRARNKSVTCGAFRF